MSDSQERRRFSRISFRAEVTLKQGSQSWDCRLLDISLKGLLIDRPNNCQLEASPPIDITIGLDDGSLIEMQAELAREDDQLLAFTRRIIDLDSLSHLRRLVELNLGDDEAADREISELVSL